MLRLALALFAVQAGFHGFTASLPLALARAGVPDPQIGLIVGTAALVQVPAALAAGALVDRFGGLRIFAVGGLAYLVGTAILLLPGVEPGGSPVPFLLARLAQGIGIASTLPSALSLVPRLLPPSRRGFGLAFMGSAHNLTLVALPPLSLAILGGSSLHGVAFAMTILIIAGLALAFVAPLPFREQDPPSQESLPSARRRLGFAFRSSWAVPLAIVLLYVAHWGVVTAYLPQRAEAVGADIGLFFVADGLAVLLLRVPSGWLADRTRPISLLLAGLGLTTVAIGTLVLPPTTPLLILSGALTGAGAGLLLTPLLVELSRRSGDADRGSAFALFSAALAGALVLGSIGAAPIVAAFGFEAAILVTLAALAVAAGLALADRSFRRMPARDVRGAQAA
jgi:MFS family permease